MFEIGLPLSKIVIYVQTGHAIAFGLELQPGNIPSHRHGRRSKLFSILEFQIINDIDQQEREIASMEYAFIVHRWISLLIILPTLKHSHTDHTGLATMR
jgi:hypothetical protein